MQRFVLLVLTDSLQSLHSTNFTQSSSRRMSRAKRKFLTVRSRADRIDDTRNERAMLQRSPVEGNDK